MPNENSKVIIELVRCDDLPLVDFMPVGARPMGQRFTAVSTSLFKRRYHFEIRGSVDPGSYIVEMVSINGERIATSPVEVMPDKARDVSINCTITAPAFGEFDVRLVMQAAVLAMPTAVAETPAVTGSEDPAALPPASEPSTEPAAG